MLKSSRRRDASPDRSGRSRGRTRPRSGGGRAPRRGSGGPRPGRSPRGPAATCPEGSNRGRRPAARAPPGPGPGPRGRAARAPNGAAPDPRRGPTGGGGRAVRPGRAGPPPSRARVSSVRSPPSSARAILRRSLELDQLRDSSRRSAARRPADSGPGAPRPSRRARRPHSRAGLGEQADAAGQMGRRYLRDGVEQELACSKATRNASRWSRAEVLRNSPTTSQTGPCSQRSGSGRGRDRRRTERGGVAMGPLGQPLARRRLGGISQRAIGRVAFQVLSESRAVR